MEKSLAVSLKGAYKSYGKRDVLKNLGMHVQRGTIYGLLGSSGCGKTTLLSCIVGQKQLDSGELWVLGGRPGEEGSGIPGPRVGFMPQETALVNELTVKDTIYFFGRLMDMPENLISERFLSLTSLLDLPPANRFVKDCSGGQQRRISFAASMVHMPELVILDEPTVGVDPVLRERIWDYLTGITKRENISVIITTHYIEETRDADVIGLMRDGKLLAEESPQSLLTRFQEEYLENVFLILSKRQEEGRLNGSASNATSDRGNRHPGTEKVTSPDAANNERRKKVKRVGGYSLNRKRMKALLDKNWKKFYRNSSGAIFVFLFPIMQILAFLFAVGADVKGINLAIVNDETMSISCPNFTFAGTAVPYNITACEMDNLSCRFLTYLKNPMIEMIEYSNLEKAIQDIRSGKAVGALYMADNFTKSLEHRLHFGRRTSSEIFEFSQVKVWMDLSNRQIGQNVKYRIRSLYVDFQRDMMKDCNFNPNFTDVVDLKTINGDKDEVYTVFMVPGVILTIMFFITSLITAQIIINDRTEGVWDRSHIAGVSSLELTLSHLSLQSIVVAIYTLEVLVITFVFFGYEYVGSMWLMVVITFLQGLTGASYGFWISVVSRSHAMSHVISSGSFYIMIMICGLLWPIEGMPRFLQWISKCLPFTVPMQSFRNVMKKGWNITNWEVFNGILVEAAWIVGLAVLSTVLIKSKK